MANNPFSSPNSAVHPTKSDGPSVSSSFSRPLAAIGLAATGFFIALFFLIIGYVLLIALLDETLCPPLERQGNFGQFGFLIILIAPLFLLSGTSFGLIPFLRWWIWAICFLIIFSVMYFLTGLLEPWHYNLLHVTNVAIYLTGFVLLMCGLLARCIYRFIERGESEYATMNAIVG